MCSVSTHAQMGERGAMAALTKLNKSCSGRWCVKLTATTLLSKKTRKQHTY